jgi:hypothetical protein
MPDFQVFIGDGCGVEIIDGNKYEGNFKDGLAEGHGKKTWVTGERYIGEWRDGLRHGKGECCYQGGFADQLLFSLLVPLAWSNLYVRSLGAKYTGQFADGTFHGQGR